MKMIYKRTVGYVVSEENALMLLKQYYTESPSSLPLTNVITPTQERLERMLIQEVKQEVKKPAKATVKKPTKKAAKKKV